MVRGALGAVLAMTVVLSACDDDTGEGSAGGAGGAPANDMGAGAAGDGSMRMDAGRDQGPAPDVGPSPDMGGRPDQGPQPDMGPPPDMGPAPDVGPLDGEPCDPRLRARSTCGAGGFCVHVPGAARHIGRCQSGDDCTPGTAGSCADPARSYCHVRGAATVCTAPGALGPGEPCVNELGIPQPCADGHACNFAVCVKLCDPGVGVAENGCADSGRCADVSELLGDNVGWCAPRGCNWFTGEQCAAGQKCSYAIRNDGVTVGSCTEDHGANQVGTPCQFFPNGGDNCAQGLTCVGPPDQERFCRILCDTGGYEAPCPAGMVCQELLQTRVGPVRGYGICVTNQ